MTTSSPIISAAQFEAAFRLDPNPWPNSPANRALVQLGLPSPTALTLWLAPERGGRLEPRVSLPQYPQVVPRFVSAGSTGPQRVELSGLTPSTTYAIDVATTASGPTQRLTATTAPAATDTGEFSFLATSCFAPYDDPATFAQAAFEWRFRLHGNKGKPPHITQRTAHALRLLQQRANASAPQKPAFWLGLGDQVYVDTGKDAGQAMLTGTKANEKRYAPAELPQFFETIYRAYFSLEPYASALQALPTAMIWDDHEIRDGWGSHGDEENSDEWRQHLEVARDYFVGWQASRNPPAPGAVATTEGYAEAARVGTSPTKSSEFDFGFDWGSQTTFFIMDLRSQRDTLQGQAGSEAQIERLKAWFASRDDSPTLWVLGSPLPLSLSKRVADTLQRWLICRRKDDMRDAWSSAPLTKQREEILKTIADHFHAHRSHRLLILSGDVHFSELLELSDERDRNRVYGHEIVSSGLAQTYFKFMRCKSQKKALLSPGLSAVGLGRFHGPCFAEIFVKPKVGAAPDVEVTFHAAVDCSGKHLANLGGPSPVRLQLPLETLTKKYGRDDRLFAEFIHEAKETDATAIEPAPGAGARS